MPINVTMPALSPTMTEGTLSRWLKAEGDNVAAGDIIAEIETDKATMEVEAVDEGVLGKILVQAGTEGVAVNTPIAILLEDGEDASALKNMPAPAPVPSKAEPAQAPAQQSSPAAAQTPAPAPRSPSLGNGRVFASPLAKRMAREQGIEISALRGSGPHGRIVKADIERAVKQGAAPASPARSAPSTAQRMPEGDYEINAFGMAYRKIPNNNIKKITAKRLLESKQTVPHFYLTIDCRLDSLMAARQEINDQADGSYKLSVNDFLIKACAMALKSFPTANVSWTDEAVHQYLKADVSVAVATPNGLITPIVRNAEDKGLIEISAEVKDLAKRARDSKLKPEEFQGGSFTISNLGMFGIREFGAIINPPQACILAIGAGEQRPVIERGEVKIGTMMSCTLSVDHRAVDGAVGAEYLKVFKRYVENPVSMLL
ncbi:MAG: pyruvate dehydrogenase complex dihydrolipoamide acetyltransferase [Alphaproteobacteria bacterium]|nr:pyruvate dehydrogenase complex dihydrolipoamide acetyltransferase [Alphaproteobacteria bacterium]